MKKYQAVFLLGIIFLFLEVAFFFIRIQNGMPLIGLPILFSGSFFRLLFYLFTVNICILSLSIFPMMKNRLIAYLSLLIIIGFYMVDLIYLRINNWGFSFNELSIILSEYENNFTNVIRFYFPQMNIKNRSPVLVKQELRNEQECRWTVE